MQFTEFPLLMVTGKSSPLRAVGEKLGAKIVTHPSIGGRYTALTEVNLLPAALVGFDAQSLFEGAEKFYQEYKKENLAWKAASVFWQLEQKGYVDVLMFFYSHSLYPMSASLVQLCHESFGKGGKGQTYFAHEGPEVQHHTTQRFYGGKKNIAGIFLTLENFLHPTQNVFPTKVHSVQIKERHLADVDKVPLEKALQFEWQANLEESKIFGIPVMHMSLTGLVPEEMGALTAFWQLYAVYSSVLRGVDPFDQPQVENSKNNSFNKRLSYKGLL
jgi:glucose-6-phosphate isomerase